MMKRTQVVLDWVNLVNLVFSLCVIPHQYENHQYLFKKRFSLDIKTIQIHLNYLDQATSMLFYIILGVVLDIPN